MSRLTATPTKYRYFGPTVTHWVWEYGNNSILVLTVPKTAGVETKFELLSGRVDQRSWAAAHHWQIRTVIPYITNCISLQRPPAESGGHSLLLALWAIKLRSPWVIYARRRSMHTHPRRPGIKVVNHCRLHRPDSSLDLPMSNQKRKWIEVVRYEMIVTDIDCQRVCHRGKLHVPTIPQG